MSRHDIVFKFALSWSAKPQRLTVPKGALPVRLGVQNGVPCLWALVESWQDEEEELEIIKVGTGHPIPAGRWTHLATEIVDDDEFVWHFFGRQVKADE